ncbi:hypothetical protein C2G38_2203032 [Gigaspora rosea]|uniref:Uncharacterized protein n=1 Tax=Gigaspora rosea TaxID=44941 RepID=A0A397UMX7_9GLOM|nr:hypothetical protein C2G38_2203032 [Gigaspora rosea]
MEEFLYKALSESKEVYDEEFDTSIEHETYDETLTFDHHSLKILKNLQEIMTQSINKSDDELFESDDKVFQNDDETESLKEFEQPLPLIPNPNVKTAHCVIVDNDNDDNMIQRCTVPGERYLRQLSGAWEIDSQAVKDVKRDISALRICLRHLNFDQRTVHEFESKKEQSTNESKTCLLHTWKVCECIIQAPCVDLFKCPAITEYEDLSKKSLPGITDKPRFICTSCFVKNGAKWIEQTAESEDESKKISILKELVKLFNNITTDKSKMENTISTSSTISTVPSCFLIKTAFAIKKIKVSEEQDQEQLLKNITSHSLEIRVLAYVKDYEVCTQKKRMFAADPRLRINLNPNVINIAAIDNIDLKDATFQYGNIFDVVCNTAHATARMVFQYQYLELVNLDDDIRNYSSFGISSIMEQCQTTIDWIFNQLINIEQTFNIEHINEAIKANIDSTLFVDPPNVVILKPGKAPSKDEHVHNAVDMFLEDFGYTEDGVLNLVCDEAIYHRMKSYKSNEQTLEQVVDYRATFRVLELLWTAVGIAIHQYIQTENISINNIPKTNNNILKIWYNFYLWPQLLQNLRTVPSINLTQEGHYFAFDEALETFGIKFLKENMTGCAINLENLELNIKAAQTEDDRLNLLISEFTNDQSVSRSSRSIKSRQEVLWKLIYDLKLEFINQKPETLELNDDMEVEKINQNSQLESSSGLSHQKRQHSTHIPTDIEEQILIELEKYKDSTVLLPEIVEDLVEKLAIYTDYWTSN